MRVSFEIKGSKPEYFVNRLNLFKVSIASPPCLASITFSKIIGPLIDRCKSLQQGIIDKYEKYVPTFTLCCFSDEFWKVW